MARQTFSHSGPITHNPVATSPASDSIKHSASTSDVAFIMELTLTRHTTNDPLMTFNCKQCRLGYLAY